MVAHEVFARFSLRAQVCAWSIVVCASGALSVSLGAAAIPYFTPGEAFTSATVNVFLGAGLLGTWVLTHCRPYSRETPWLAVLVFSMGSVAAVSYLLWSALYGAGGVVGDAGWQTAIAGKAAEGMANTDFQQKGLPPFYPSLYWNLVGTLAWLFGVSAETAVKQAAIALTFLSPMLLFGLWRSLAGGLGAMWLALSVSLGETEQVLHKPHEYLSLIAFMPWWIAFVEPSPRDVTRRDTLVGGAIGAAIFCTYYYWFFIGGLVLVSRLAYAFGTRRHQAFFRDWKRGALTLGVAALMSSYYWAPLLVSFAQYGCEPLQNRWLTESMTRWPMRNLSWSTALAVTGIVYLYLSRSGRLERALLLLGGGALLWFFLGLVGILLDTPTLHVRAARLLELVGYAGAALLLERLRRRLGSTKDAKARLASRRVFSAAVLVSGLAFAGVPSDFAESSLYEQANNVRDSIEGQVEDLGLDTRGATFLSADEGVYRTLSAYNFISENAFIAHPASQFSERLEFLRTLARVRSKSAFCWLLRNNRFEPIDYLFLPKGKLVVRDDNFPTEPAHKRVKLRFSKSLLNAPCLQELDIFYFEDDVAPLLRVVDTQTKRPRGGRDRRAVQAFGK